MVSESSGSLDDSTYNGEPTKRGLPPTGGSPADFMIDDSAPPTPRTRAEGGEEAGGELISAERLGEHSHHHFPTPRPSPSPSRSRSPSPASASAL